MLRVQTHFWDKIFPESTSVLNVNPNEKSIDFTLKRKEFPHDFDLSVSET